MAMLLTACAGFGIAEPPPAGTSLQSLQQRMGEPTAVHRLPDGVQRNEYAFGPLGKFTYMVDVDVPQQRVLRSEQVLDESHFARIHAGMTQQDVAAQIGRPARVWGVHYHDQTVWSYRFESPFCRLFHVGFTPDGRVDDTSYGVDPLCDRKSRDGR